MVARLDGLRRGQCGHARAAAPEARGWRPDGGTAALRHRRTLSPPGAPGYGRAHVDSRVCAAASRGGRPLTARAWLGLGRGRAAGTTRTAAGWAAGTQGHSRLGGSLSIRLAGWTRLLQLGASVEKQSCTDILREVSVSHLADPVLPRWGRQEDGVGSFSRGAGIRGRLLLSHDGDTDPRHLS